MAIPPTYRGAPGPAVTIAGSWRIPIRFEGIASPNADDMTRVVDLGQDAGHGIRRSDISERHRDTEVLGSGRRRHRLDGGSEHRTLLRPPPGPRGRVGGDQRPP